MSMVFEKDSKALAEMAVKYPNPKEGDLIVGPYVICKTCAYYVGQWCAEYMDFGNGGQWIYQPYDRTTDYMATVEEAQSMLKSFDQDLSGATDSNAVQSEPIWNEDRLEFESPCRMED